MSRPDAEGTGLIPSRGAGIPHALGPKNHNIKQKQYCNKFNQDIKKSFLKSVVGSIREKIGSSTPLPSNLDYKDFDSGS